MKLSEIVDHTCTDKNSRHSYLDVYQDLMGSKRDSAESILEVGIEKGGSIRLWRDFFKNATIYGLDVMNVAEIEARFANEAEIQNIKSSLAEISQDGRLKLRFSYDAYNENLFYENFLSKDLKFDFIIDDGPHTLESMCFFVNFYSKILTSDGVLIVEDVQSIDWIKILTYATPEDLRQYIKVFDLRHIKDRYDDILFVIDKRCIKLL